MSAGAIVVIHRRLRRSHDEVSEVSAREDQYRLHEPNHQSVRGMASGFRHSHAPGSYVREDLPDSSERFSSAGRICQNLDTVLKAGGSQLKLVVNSTILGCGYFELSANGRH